MNERGGTGRLADRVVIVTGASRGLGKATAVLCAREGGAVAVVARTEQVWDERMPGTVHDTVAEIEAGGGRAIAVRADLAQPDDVERIVDVVHAELGPVDVLVNNAALTIPGRPPEPGSPARTTPVASATLSPPAPAASPEANRPRTRRAGFLEFPLKGFRLHFEIGLFASYRLMQLVLPDMIEKQRGAIVNISSQAAFVPGEGPYERAGISGGGAYGGNKAALQHLTQSVAFEMQPHGIAVNALLTSSPVLSPGNLVAAPNVQNWASPDDFAEAVVRLAVVSPEEMTGWCVYHEDVLHPELGRRGWLGERPAPT
jgi:NAD(P)-dependent dehydrogenase (short-subunit alcohol dehydrogenase family)